MVAFTRGGQLERVQIFAKSADESVTSSTTLQNDDHLVDIPLYAGAVYALDGCLYFDASADGPGIKFDFAMTAQPADECVFNCHAADSAANTHGDTMTIITSATTSGNFDTTLLADGNDPTVSIKGIVFAPSGSDATFLLRWAQSSSSATALTLKAGSWLRLMRIS